MSYDLINHELSVSFPDDFHVMDEEELRDAYTDDYPSRWAIRSGDGSIMIAVFWHQSNVMLTALADSRYMISGIEARIKKTLKNHGYKRDGFYAREICGHKARGFRYEYTPDEDVWNGEAVMFKHESRIYTIYFYAKRFEEGWLVEGKKGAEVAAEDRPSARQTLEQFLKSMDFVEEED